MNILLWVLQLLLALIFLMAGMMKLRQSKEEMAERMAWVEDFSQQTIRIIGVLEVLGALGMVLPWATGILPWLTPVAAIGLALTMLGAIATHIKRKEYAMMGMNVVLLIMAVVVAYGRFAL